MKAHKSSVLALALAIVMVCISGCDFATSSSSQIAQNPGLQNYVTVVSEPFTLDGKYASMEGPSGLQDVYLLDTPEPELLWITAIEANIVDAANENNAMPPELMCHTNLDLDVIKYPNVRDRYKIFSLRTTPRLFTLSQGQSSIKLSDGFGIPIRSDESLRLTTQVLNAYDEYIGSEIKQNQVETHTKKSERALENQGQPDPEPGNGSCPWT